MTLVAAIDCGTNTIRLLIAEVTSGRSSSAAGSSGETTLVDVVREQRVVRLGQGVDRTGRLTPEALARTFAALDEYAALIREHEVPGSSVRFVATSASRDAENADEFMTGVRERLGIDPEVISGSEEAALAFDGAVSGFDASRSGPLLVVDIGGGSTELIRGSDAGLDAAFSMDIGSVRLTERHLHSDPPTREELNECIAAIDGALDASPVPPTGAGTLIGVAGTFTQLAALVLGLTEYQPWVVHNARLQAADLRGLASQLLRMTVAERLALPTMEPGRADVIIAGALIADRIVGRHVAAGGTGEVVVSEADILDGIARSLVG